MACNESLDFQQAISHALQRIQYGTPNFQLSACTSHRFFFVLSMKVYAKEQGIQDSIANGQYPNYKDTNRQNEKEANIKVKLMKVWK